MPINRAFQRLKKPRKDGFHIRLSYKREKIKMSYIIKSADELKDPFLCYCVFRKFIEEAGEDYIDYNESIINSIPFIFWLRGRNDINNEQLETFLSNQYKICLQDVLKDEVLFPNTYGYSFLSDIKAYTLLAEYMCQLKEFRTRLWNSVNDEATNFENESFYKDSNDNSLACIIEENELNDTGYSYKDVLDMPIHKMWELSYKNQFNIGIKMTIRDADIETKSEYGYNH